MLKGALVSVSSPVPLPSMIRFQYNPEKLTRKVTPAFYSGGNSRAEPARFGGAPAETIDLEAKFDATDGLESGGISTKMFGIRPRLSALELYAYPSLVAVGKDLLLYKAGKVGAVPVPAARTLLIFGMSRIVPVRITSVSITEELFDSNLNPIRATANLSMEVISYSQVTNPKEPLSVAFLAYQGVMETQALALKAQEALWAAKQGMKAAGKVAGAAKKAIG